VGEFEYVFNEESIIPW